MQCIGRRIFRWLSLALLVLVLLLFCWLALLFIRYPASRQQFIAGCVLLALCAIPLGSLAWWAVKGRSPGDAA